jgi:hypothetical protein
MHITAAHYIHEIFSSSFELGAALGITRPPGLPSERVRPNRETEKGGPGELRCDEPGLPERGRVRQFASTFAVEMELSIGP